MNQATKGMLCEAAVAVLACGAVEHFLLRPAATAVTQARSEVSAMVARGVGARTGTELSEAQLTALLRTTSARTEQIREHGEMAADEARIFAAVMSLAEELGIRVDQMQPVTAAATRTSGSLASPPTDPSAPPAPRDLKNRYSLSIAGQFPAVVAFLQGLCDRTGYTVINHAQFTQAAQADRGLVHAQIETEHHVFDTAAVRALAGPVSTQSAATPEVRP